MRWQGFWRSHLAGSGGLEAKTGTLGYGGARWDRGRGHRLVAELAGRTFDEFVLDVGFDTSTGVEPDRPRGPHLLAFAGIDPVVVRALTLEFAVAEKVHACTRAYGDRMLASTRVKDLVDLALIAGEAALDARRLRAAIDVTFRHRATHPLPARLPRPAADWRVPYGRMCREIGLDPDLGAGHDRGRPPGRGSAMARRGAAGGHRAGEQDR